MNSRLLKQLASQTAVYGLSSIVGRFVNYLLVPLYTNTNILLPAEYGVSSIFYAYATFAAVVFSYGMETAFFRFYQKEDSGKVLSTSMLSVTGSSLLLCLLIIVFAGPISHFSHDIGMEQYFRIFAVILASDALTKIPFAYLRMQNKAGKFVALQLLSIGLNVGLNLFFYLLCPYMQSKGYHSFDAFYHKENGVLYMFLANLISSVAILPFFYKEFLLIRTGFDSRLWKEMMIYAFPLLFMGLAGMINETLDRLVLKKYISLQEIGIYAANYKLAVLMNLFIQAFRFAAEPFFFARSKDKEAPRTYAAVMLYFVIFCCIIFLGVTLYIDIFKHFLTSPVFWTGLDIVPILLMAYLFLGIYYNISVWYKLADKTKFGAIISIIGAVITIVLLYITVPLYGYRGAAWTTLICYVSMVAISYFIGKKYYDVPYKISRISGYLLLAVALYFAGRVSNVLIMSDMVLYIFNGMLLLGFIITAFLLERKNLKEITI